MNEGWLGMLVLALAAWRLSYMLVRESGPADMFGRFRYFVGLRSLPIKDETGQLMVGKSAKNWVAELLDCIWCTSIWTAGGLVGINFLVRAFNFVALRLAFDLIVSVLALSAGAIVFNEIVERVRR